MGAAAALRIGVVATALLAAALVFAESSAGEVTSRGGLAVRWHGEISPRKRPRQVPAPATFRLRFRSSLEDSAEAPQLSGFGIEILGRSLRLDPAGLAPCSPRILLQPDISATACDGSLVGHGNITFEPGPPEPVGTRVLGRFRAFYAHEGGRPGIVAVVRARLPAPTTFLIPLTLATPGHGHVRARISLENGAIPERLSRIASFEMSLHRVFAHGGERRSFVSATCPHSGIVQGAGFPFLSASFTYSDGTTVRGQSFLPTCSIRPS